MRRRKSNAPRLAPPCTCRNSLQTVHDPFQGRIMTLGNGHSLRQMGTTPHLSRFFSPFSKEFEYRSAGKCQTQQKGKINPATVMKTFLTLLVGLCLMTGTASARDHHYRHSHGGYVRH